MDWTAIPGYKDEDPAHKVMERYARLSPFELRALRDRLQLLAEEAEEEFPDTPFEADHPFEGFEARVAHRHCERLANKCDRLLSWHPYAAEWDWGQIIGNGTLRAHANAVRSAMRHLPDDESPTGILRRASAYYGYDAEDHRNAIEEYIQAEKERQSFPDVNKIEAAVETLWDGYDEGARPNRVRNQYDEAGWSGANQGGREELEKLTKAILWATESGSEDTEKPALKLKIENET